MRVVSITNQVHEAAFAKRAAAHFAKNPRHYTYAEHDPEPGKLLAIRWNSFTVLVVTLADDHVPALYPTHDLIQSDLPPLQGEPAIQWANGSFEQMMGRMLNGKREAMDASTATPVPVPTTARWVYKHEGD